MAQKNNESPITVRCPNCRQTKEPDYNDTTRHHVCPLCGEQVDAQVFIEKRKRGIK